MADLQVCRICLATNVKMHSLQSYPLEIYYESIYGTSPLNIMELPSLACFECSCLIRKFYYFKQQCMAGESALYEILQSAGKSTQQMLRQINCRKLPSNLSFRTLLSVDIKGDTTSDVKEEYSLEDHAEDFDIKEEFAFEEVPSPYSIGKDDVADAVSIVTKVDEDNLSSDDNEPLSQHKKLKVKAKKTKKKKNKKHKTIELKIESEGLDLETAETGVVELSVPAKRRVGRPKKNSAEPAKPRRTKNTGGVQEEDIDINEFTNVVRLTLEEQMEEISKRQTSSNYMNAPYKCNFCYKGFIDTEAWKHHVVKHEPSAGDEECPVCRIRFKNRRALQKHATNHERKFACKACSYVSKTTTQAKQHQLWHKGVTYKCQHCDEVSTKWTSYLSHVRMKHPSEHVCEVCGYSFVSRLGLAMHRTMMHKDVQPAASDPALHCAECGVTFATRDALRRHAVTSAKHKGADHGCKACGATFASGEELRVHHRREHARPRPKNYGKPPAAHAWPAQCEHCPEQIPNAREYWTHFRRAHPDKEYPIQKNYVCDVCGKSFRANAFLVYHKRTHGSERQFRCGACGKAFHNRANLHMHARAHSDARPHACQLCHKAFKCKAALDRHFRSHTGVKPYSCEVCGKEFSQSNSRKIHVQTVHLKQPAPYVSKSRLARRAPPPQPPLY